MKILAVTAVALTFAGCTITLHEDPKILDALNGISTSIQTLRPSPQQQAAAPQKTPQHVVCRHNEKGERGLVGVDQVNKDEKDLGALSACPPPNDVAACIGGEAFSNVQARCAAGKL